jgi:hypothetical protein
LIQKPTASGDFIGRRRACFIRDPRAFVLGNHQELAANLLLVRVANEKMPPKIAASHIGLLATADGHPGDTIVR